MKNTKGISPVVSDLLLATIVVAAFAIVYAATTGITTQMYNYFSDTFNRITEDLIIEEAYIKSGNETVTLYIRNIGEITSKITSIYCNGTLIDQVYGELTIKKNKLTIIKIKLPKKPSPYAPQEITIATALGSKFTARLITQP